jgi:hypothetical protein
MNTPFQFRQRLATRGEILAQQVTFLPVEATRPGQPPALYAPEMQHFGGFLPIFDPSRKKMTVAQSLLKEVLR